MAKLTLHIVGDNSDALQKIKSVDQAAKNLSNTVVQINVDASGLDAVSEKANKVLNAQAKLIREENRLAIEREKTKQATEARKRAEVDLAVQMEKTATAEEQARRANTQLSQQIEKTRTEEAKLAVEEAKLAVQEEKTATAAENRATAEAKATGATKQLGEETEKTARKSESLLDNFQKFARWYIIGNVFSSIVRSLREALTTMKAVDDELVTIRKVTGFSDSQIAGIREQAYSTASAYGIGASDYLESVAAYSRAGYKEQAAALAELSAKTQIVGDTTAETANQFLLSVDKAYQYKGSIDELTKVLDGANEIDNKYATSIEKIAEGMGIVAPVAAQMHVDVNELAAAIGTITSVTQRTGSEAARALRAIMLNIVGDTKTEIDEGVTWTTGEIAGLRDVIRQYAPDAYKAAEATGSIIDPMEAVAGLAQSMQDGLLTEQKLMDMVSDIGGKLRSSQLLALIQNWDMYQSMLVDYGNAIGSADKEVENALDSWSRKTEQLSNTWAKFISHLIETKTIKTAIDGLTGAIRLLDSPLGQGAAKAAALVGAFVALNALMHGALLTGLKALVSQLIGTAGAIQAANVATMGWIGIAVVAIAALVTIYNQLNVTAKEHLENAKKLQDEYKSLESELDSIWAKLEENHRLIREGNEAGADEKYLTRLRNENEQLATQYSLLKAQADLKRQAAMKEAKAAYNAKSYTWNEEGYTDSFGGGPVSIMAVGNITEYAKHLIDLAVAGDDVSTQLSEVFGTLAYLNETFADGDDEAAGYAAEIANVYEYYKQVYPEAVKVTEELEKQTQAGSGTAEELQTVVKVYDGMKEKLGPLSDAMAQLTAQGYMDEAAMKALIAAYPDLEDAITATSDGFVISKEAIMENVLALWAEYSAINNNAAAASMVQILALNNENGAWAANTAEIKKNIAARIAALEAEQLSTHLIGNGYSGTYYGESVGLTGAEANELSMLKGLLRSIDSYGASTATSSGSSGGGGGFSKSTTDTKLESLKDMVSLRKQELSYLEASGASTEEQIAAMCAIQDALHEQAEYLRQSEAYLNGDADALKEVKALSTEWWTYQNKITKALEDAQKALKENALKLLETQREAAINPLKEQLELLKSQKDTVQEEREEEEKLLAVEKARIALENAQNERNVRQFNAKTGQWEWVANATAVSQAQESLSSAKKSLNEYYEDKQRAQQIAAMEASIKSTEAYYNGLKTVIENSGSGSNNEVLEQMKKNSAAWHGADSETQKRLAEDNYILGMSQGWTRKYGTWYDASGNQLYDSGGILRGVGGIKATREDEMILPPNLTSALLNAEANGAFESLLRHLGIVTSVASGYAGYRGGTVRNSIGSQHNGDCYTFGDISLTEAQARGMTVYDLAQMARTLSLHSA